ncbi:uncharacterized protein DSM5745_02510 [Aspergillus mulundensis]|uniref:Uncharacterized protein n=1 Tax=Aspergillus mulundensis TaxID=1810919 RepID=A0A3D8SWQ0_9EURO|nr:hypothetical protein DSM5745_02510 [Aspergillus mulundensis]RDW90735.1 hypothetical protein DSM5745_02510 [Aspergillus mulundensis]
MPISQRKQALLEANRTGQIPLVGSKYAGWYHAPNGKRYFGLGTVMEIGLTHDGGFYVRSEPVPNMPDKRWTFFDPATDEDMPADQLPEDYDEKCDRAEDHPRPGRDFHKMPTPKPGKKPGDVAYGFYTSAKGLLHFGPGRVVTNYFREDGSLRSYAVEPLSVRGGLPFWESDTGDDIAEEDLPRSYYSGSLETQQRKNKDRPRWEDPPEKDDWLYWYGRLPPMPDCDVVERYPRLGTEHSGAYFAPDGQWFAGVGTVVAVGYTPYAAGFRCWYVFVEPITGKSGGVYDFFHPKTYEWMDELPSNPIPGESCAPSVRRKLPTRWYNLPAIRRQPNIGEEYSGRYFPPNAPKRDVYLGVGKVLRTGVTKEGRIWVDVAPIPGKRGGHYTFFNPWTGKTMPDEYLPNEE